MLTQPPQHNFPTKLRLGLFSVIAVIITFPLVLLLNAVRQRCPNCQRRGLRSGLCTADPALTGDARPFFLSECDYCHHQFWELQSGDRKLIHIPPTDQRYTRAEEPPAAR